MYVSSDVNGVITMERVMVGTGRLRSSYSRRRLSSLSVAMSYSIRAFEVVLEKTVDRDVVAIVAGTSYVEVRVVIELSVARTVSRISIGVV